MYYGLYLKVKDGRRVRLFPKESYCLDTAKRRWGVVIYFLKKLGKQVVLGRVEVPKLAPAKPEHVVARPPQQEPEQTPELKRLTVTRLRRLGYLPPEDPTLEPVAFPGLESLSVAQLEDLLRRLS